MNGKQIMLLLLFSFLSCVQREEGMGSRNNPFDPGGENWIFDALPEVSVGFDSLWVDFNHADSTGTIALHLMISDRNFPFDTITGTVSVNNMLMHLQPTGTSVDTLFPIDRLKTASVYRCSTAVIDIRDKGAFIVCTLTTLSSVPPLPPRPSITPGIYAVTITWQLVPSATSYSIYTASSSSGPFQKSRSIGQPGSGMITIYDTIPGYAPRFYRFASHNASGASFLRDTLMGRKYYTGILTPSISSVTKGSYDKYIRLSIYNGSSDLRYLEIYRSIADTLSFRLIDTLMFGSSYSSIVYYNDTVNTGDTCFYRVTAVDRQDRCSLPSATGFGFVKRLPAPGGFNIVAYNDYLKISWQSIPTASYYRIYRSDKSCPESMKLLNTTANLLFNDTTPTDRVYYYTVRGVDIQDLEGLSTACISSRINVLSAPTGLTASNEKFLRHVELSWNAVAGASGYIITRGAASDSFLARPLDTVAATHYNDTVPENSGLFYYRVAAFNQRGTGLFCAAQAGRVILPPALQVTNYPKMVALYWNAHAQALSYYIFRSGDSASFTCIDSTTGTFYFDSLTKYRKYFYRLAIRTSEGMSGFGNTASGHLLLEPPLGLIIVEDRMNLILRWNRVAGAERYRIFRSLTPIDTILYRETVDTFYVDATPPKSQYFYRVDAAIGEVTSDVSKAVCGSNHGLPSTPIDFSVNGDLSFIKITWSIDSSSALIPGIYICSASVSGFYIYRSRSNTGPFVCIDSTVNCYYHDPVPDTFPYYYKIAAFNSSGVSSFTPAYIARRMSSSVNAPAMISATEGTLAGRIIVTWSASINASGYRLYRAPTDTFNRNIILLRELTGTSFVDSVFSDSIYFYKVKAYNGNIESVFSDFTARGFRSPQRKAYPPTNIYIWPHTGGIYIGWEEPSTAVGYTGYAVYRSTSSGGPFERIATTTSTGYEDVPPQSNPVVYWYLVTTINQMGESSPSEYVSGARN